MIFKFQISNLKFQIAGMVVVSAFFSFSCSVPNLEQAECTESRGVVKKFYSLHFAKDLKLNKDDLKDREQFLSENLRRNLKDRRESEQDFFTRTADYPKAFRLGECKVVSAEKTGIEVLLFWKDDTRSEQREISVETVKKNGVWLIDNVADRQ